MNVVHSFAPIASPAARTVILGSMPGVASLKAQQYYAHPRNAFWPIVCTLFDIDPSLEYRTRTAALADRGVAVWDVLKLCTRAGSLDSAIDPDSFVVNDFSAFYADHPNVDRVFFNGTAAAQMYTKHVHGPAGLTLTRLPSTSPAHASLSLPAKLDAWRVVAAGHRHPSASRSTRRS